MENPAKEIESVIQALVSSPPSKQHEVIETYFLQNASFTHPFCRTGSFDGSRFLIRAIYRWYKIMSPKIDLTVHSVSYDEPSETLYVSISQIFRVWMIPFYEAPVSLVTVLKLHRDSYNGLYYLKSQEDLYQTSEFIKFVLPGIGSAIVWLGQFFATLMCVVLAWVFWPVSWFEEHGIQSNSSLGEPVQIPRTEPSNGDGDDERGRKADRLDGVDAESEAQLFEKARADANVRGGLVTAPSIEHR